MIGHSHIAEPTKEDHLYLGASKSEITRVNG